MFLIDPNDEQAAERAARHAAICQELLELGMQAIRQTAAAMQTPQETPQTYPAAPDLHARFERLARCIRQTMLLENHIADARRAIVTKTIQLRKDIAFAATVMNPADTHAPGPPRPERPERLDREHFHAPPNADQMPSLLETISYEIGVDITDPAVLGSFHNPTDPPPD